MIPIPKSKEHILESWPRPAESPGYTVLRGDPQTDGCFIQGNNTTPTRLGIWRCTEGTFEVTERGDELQTLIKGRLRLTGEDGVTHEYGPGDSIFTRKGERVIWDIRETVEKVFYAVA
ncbi:MAG: cupin domain-containing protein [Pseudomonadota bacterium]